MSTDWKGEYLKKALAEANSVWRQVKKLHDTDNTYTTKNENERLQYCIDKFPEFYKANIPVLTYMSAFGQYNQDAYRRWIKLKLAKGVYSQGNPAEWAESNAVYTKLLLTSLKWPPQIVAKKYQEALKQYTEEMEEHQRAKEEARQAVEQRQEKADAKRREILLERLKKVAQKFESAGTQENKEESDENDENDK